VVDSSNRRLTRLGSTAKVGSVPQTFVMPAALGRRPELAAGFARMTDALGRANGLSPLVLDAVTHRVRVLMRLASGPTPGEGDPQVDAAVAVAEMFVIDPHGLEDAVVSRATSQLGEDGVIALMTALALADGFGRFERLLDK
jgi:hypothetical protein